ncbi:MmgE/PrpD family protein [Oceanibacterium hippocampi]|uniref:2-methylcitrate dehydratase n=1 Tax=Oceanibacterium hippocampi TaxID=745714 RepID=A0A1Y5TXS7_9PROT|nr:MmgE/PrpD family protein [Oceanibacterium hippocampi]SLN75351.1 2-methylcitrate dehydratase [Oceanibacterium hippocampi]
MNVDGQSAGVVERLVQQIGRPVAPDTRARAALHLVDWLGCALAGHGSEAGAILADGLAPSLFAGHGRPRLADMNALAFGLGGLGSILEMDDVHRTALLHPGPVILPATLAASNGRNGMAFLDAVVRGYEAMIRLGRAVGPDHYAYFHNTSSCGGFGAAIAAGSLLGLSHERLVSAAGNAVSVSGGLWQCRHEPVMTKPFHCAEASRNGAAAAALADAGLTGPRFILEGPQGFFRALCGEGGDPAAVLAEPDAPWQIHDTSFKPWPACRHAHPAIDAALALRGSTPLDAIAAIEIATYGDAVTFCDRAEPHTETEAKFSLQHSVAVALVDGPPAMEAFAPDALGREPVAALRRLATVQRSAAFTAAYPRHFGSAVTVVLKNGQRLERTIDDAWGDSENPMSRDAVLRKSRQLMAHSGLDAAMGDRLIEAALDLADDAPVARLKTLLGEALRAAS